MESIRKINARLQPVQKEEVKKAPVVLMEDYLSKAKRALRVTKQLCPTGINVQKLESKAQLEEQGIPYNIPKVQRGLKARTRLVCSYLLSCTGL